MTFGNSRVGGVRGRVPIVPIVMEKQTMGSLAQAERRNVENELIMKRDTMGEACEVGSNEK